MKACRLCERDTEEPGNGYSKYAHIRCVRIWRDMEATGINKSSGCSECGSAIHSKGDIHCPARKPVTLSLDEYFAMSTNTVLPPSECGCRFWASVGSGLPHNESGLHHENCNGFGETMDGNHDVCPTKSGFCPCFNWAGGSVGSYREHHPNCDGKGRNKYVVDMDTACRSVIFHSIEDAPSELELLVIDLGDSCVVRVEKGEFTLAIAHTFSDDKSTMLSGHTFPELRKAIEGDKPIPRIIRDNEGYLLVEDANTNEFLAKDTYDALSQLAGKPLPIHSNGTWEQLVTTNGVTIWKYSR